LPYLIPGPTRKSSCAVKFFQNCVGGSMCNRWLLVISAAVVAGIPALSIAAEPATLIGKVTDSAGNPIEHAAVMVYEAHVRTGYSIFCPTCWADCGKHAFTD